MSEEKKQRLKEYINKNIFHRCKEPIKENIKNIVLSKKDSYGNKGA